MFYGYFFLPELANFSKRNVYNVHSDTKGDYRKEDGSTRYLERIRKLSTNELQLSTHLPVAIVHMRLLGFDMVLVKQGLINDH